MCLLIGYLSLEVGNEYFEIVATEFDVLICINLEATKKLLLDLAYLEDIQKSLPDLDFFIVRSTVNGGVIQ